MRNYKHLIISTQAITQLLVQVIGLYQMTADNIQYIATLVAIRKKIQKHQKKETKGEKKSKKKQKKRNPQRHQRKRKTVI
jgi:hypothetical protein